MRIKHFIVLLGLIVGLVGCDHATKHVAQQELRGERPVVLVSGVLDLSYTENTDTGFSALRFVPEEPRRPLILAMNFVVIAFVFVLWYRRRRERLVEHLAFGLIIAGALGNMTDRLIRGYVIDFVHLHHWPVFNAADVYLTVGAGLILLFSFTWRTQARRGPSGEAA